MESTGDLESVDLAKLKVPELKKELKARGLSSSGNKNELLERLQECLKSQNDEPKRNSSISELEEDLLNDDDDEHLDGADSVLADIDTTLDVSAHHLMTQSQKRPSEGLPEEQPKAKKLVLNRTPSGTNETPSNGASVPKPTTETEKTEEDSSEKKVIKLSDLGSKERMELRAKKFGAPVAVVVETKKAARAERFGTITVGNVTASAGKISLTNAPASIDTLKQRAQRFGGSVSSVMSKLEEQERLEKRKARFGAVNNTNGASADSDKAKQRLERFKQR